MIEKIKMFIAYAKHGNWTIDQSAKEIFSLMDEKKEVVSDSNAESSDLHTSYQTECEREEPEKLGESVTVPLGKIIDSERFHCDQYNPRSDKFHMCETQCDVCKNVQKTKES